MKDPPTQDVEFELTFLSDPNSDLDKVANEVLAHFRYAGFNRRHRKMKPIDVIQINCTIEDLTKKLGMLQLAFCVRIIYTVLSKNILRLPDDLTLQADVSQHPGEEFDKDTDMATSLQK